jgi:hypothetical protein
MNVAVYEVPHMACSSDTCKRPKQRLAAGKHRVIGSAHGPERG